MRSPSRSTADVLAQRTPVTGDLAVQAWNVTNTPMGNLNAVAASLNAKAGRGDITLGNRPQLRQPGGEQLTFERITTARYLGSNSLGLGWQPNRFSLQFQFPT